MDNTTAPLILIIDDNSANRYVTGRVLERVGFRVMEAVNGQEGLERAQQNPALIILDINLPDMSGYDVCRTLRSDPNLAVTPILHVSATYVTSADRVEGLEGGADAYLIRPIEPPELIATVRALLRIYRAEEEARIKAQEWQTTFDSMAEAACLLDREGRIQRCNAVMARLLRMTRHQPPPTPLPPNTPPTSATGRLVELLEGQSLRALLERSLGLLDSEFPLLGEDSPPTRQKRETQMGDYWFLVTVDPVFDESERRSGSVAILTDVTEHKQAQQALLEKQTQIEALNTRLQRAMVETHHRVKNNLQIIASIVEMQSMEQSDPATLRDYQSLMRQVRTLASVHDLLTEEAKEQGDALHISPHALLAKLLPMMQDSSGTRAIRFDVEDFTLPAKQGTSFGLLVNELVSNALKHSAGEVIVKCVAQGSGQAILTVCDDGPGFPPDFDAQAYANTGLELIDSLSRFDLRGKVRFGNRPEGGGEVSITFPLDTPDE